MGKKTLLLSVLFLSAGAVYSQNRLWLEQSGKKTEIKDTDTVVVKRQPFKLQFFPFRVSTNETYGIKVVAYIHPYVWDRDYLEENSLFLLAGMAQSENGYEGLVLANGAHFLFYGKHAKSVTLASATSAGDYIGSWRVNNVTLDVVPHGHGWKVNKALYGQYAKRKFSFKEFPFNEIFLSVIYNSKGDTIKKEQFIRFRLKLSD